MDASAAPVLLVEDARSPASPYTAIMSRADLDHRLHVVPVDVAPRRAGAGDVIEIGETLLSIYSAQEGRDFRRLAPETCEVFRRYHWPGNLRQLQNVLRNAVVLHDGPEVTLSMLPMELRMPESTGRGDVVYTESITSRMVGLAEPARDPGPEAPAAGDGGGVEEELATAAEAFVGMSLAEVERLVIEATIRACGGSLP